MYGDEVGMIGATATSAIATFTPRR